MTGRILENRYKLENLIGSGGMADVYLANDVLLERAVAVKILHPQYQRDMDFVERFRREAKSAASLSDPNIINVYDVGISEGQNFIVMELVSGETLKQKIREEGRLSIEDTLKISRDVASALEHAHDNSIVHCDIKPHNILIDSNGHAKVADFGIARACTETTMTYSGSVLGSVHYFSPEQASGALITPKSDIYSLGITMYEMIAGKVPFDAETPIGVAMKHMKEVPAPIHDFRPKIPLQLENLIFRMLRKNPVDRPDAQEVIEEINSIEANIETGEDFDSTVSMQKVSASKPNKKTESKKNSDSGKNNSLSHKIFGTWSGRFAFVGLFFVLIIGFGFGIILSFGRFWEQAEVSVPDVTGKNLMLARQIIEDVNLRVNVAETYSSTVPAGQVVSQDPDPSSIVKTSRLITVYVSKGGENLEIPDVVGLTKSMAVEKLQKMGMSVGSLYEKYSDEDPGIVLAQDPIMGTKSTQGQTVDLTISRGQKEETPRVRRMLAVPSVLGDPVDSARNELVLSGFSIGAITQQESRQQNGTVISQSPGGGAEREEGTPIDLVIATELITYSEPVKSEPEVEPELEAPNRGQMMGKRLE